MTMIHNHTDRSDAVGQTNGIRFAYRRFGKPGGAPLVFNQHFRGTMDYWDPAVTDGLARNREVILFNNAGVSSSSGPVPTSFQEMGADAIAFVENSWACPGSTCSAFPSAAWSPRKSLPRLPISFADSFLSARGRVAPTCQRADPQRFRRRLRSAGASLACGSLLAVPFEPGRRPHLSETQTSPQGSRSRGERRSGGGAARSHRQILRAGRERSRLSEGYLSADADCAGQQRRHRADGELLHPAAEPAERRTDRFTRTQITDRSTSTRSSSCRKPTSSSLRRMQATIKSQSSERLAFPSIISPGPKS